MEGGYVYGHDEARAYWTRQWNLLDPHVKPMRFDRRDDGRIDIEVHQVVRDLDGNLVWDLTVHHVYRISSGLIERMDIE